MGLCRRHVLTNELARDSLTTSRTRQQNACQHMHSENLNGMQAAHTAYLADVLDRIHDHKINRLDELLPWNWAPMSEAAPKSQAA